MKTFSASRVLVWFLFVVALTTTSSSLVGVQGCTNTFFTSLVELIPCRPAVTPFSPIPPSEACCNAVRILGRPCFCVLVNGPPISGVDRNMAMELPIKCGANFEKCDIGI